MLNPILDRDFLYKLDQTKHKEIYARILSLDFMENPLEQIEGKVTAGSINIDGTSAVRRTCSLTLVAKDVNINNFYWGVSNKFNLEIGVKNDIDPRYDNIIWFKQGMYVITQFNTSFSTNDYVINISGKDKMCMLNGEIGGQFPSAIDFGKLESYYEIFEKAEISDKSQYSVGKYYEENLAFKGYKRDEKQYILSTGQYDDNKIYYTKRNYSDLTDIPIKMILREAIHTYAKEPYRNIILNDIEDNGLELLEYRGDKPIYLFYDVEAGIATNFTADEKTICYYENSESSITVYNSLLEIMLKNLRGEYLKEDDYAADIEKAWKKGVRVSTTIGELKDDEYYPLTDGIIHNDPLPVYFPDNARQFYVIKIEYGDAPGYRLTDLTYPGDLVAQVGETLISVLDKIKDMLGDFEYFYDLDGHFVFQRKKTFVNTSWSTITDTGDDVYVENAYDTSAVIYSFEDSNLITSFQNNPNIANLKNDYSVWGARKGITGEIPIHARFAIDKKPKYYKTLEGIVYTIDDIETYEDYWDRRYNEFYQQVKDEIEHEYYSWEKIPNPPGLSEDWWEVRDWANRYKKITGELPKNRLREYHWDLSSSTPKKSFYVIETAEELARWKAMFPGNTRGYDWEIGRGFFLFDIDSNGKLYSLEHDPLKSNWEKNSEGYINGTITSYCGHSYEEYLDNYERAYGYIYKPNIPERDFENIIKEKVDYLMSFVENSPEVYYQRYHGNCDWREIVYQMALDYYRYGTSDSVTKIPTTDLIFQEGKNYYIRKLHNNEYVYIPIIFGETDNFKIGESTGLGNNIIYEDYSSDDFQSLVMLNNIITVRDDLAGVYEENLCPGGVTGYEQYYSDMQGFWREVFNPEPEMEYYGYGGEYKDTKVFLQSGEGVPQGAYEMQKQWVSYTEIPIGCDFYLPLNEYDQYIKEIGEKVFGVNTYNNWKIWLYVDEKLPEYIMSQTLGNGIPAEDTGLWRELRQIDITKANYTTDYQKTISIWCDYLLDFWKEKDKGFSDKYAYWHKDVIQNPFLLNFWIDFLDEGELEQYSVPVIGDRSKAVKDDQVKSIYFKETPTVIFTTYEDFVARISEDGSLKNGYTYIVLTDAMANLFSISGQGKTAKEEIDSMLYKYSYCAESITVNAISVYYLEPNTRIFISDDNSGINGEYLIDKISYSLAYDGMMSLNAVKAVERIY